MSSQLSFIYGRLFILFALIFPAVLMAGCQENNNNLYGYSFNTARISYQITGSSVGTSEVIIKGEQKVIRNNIVQTKLDGSKVTINNYLIENGEKFYTLNPDTKTGSLLKQPLYSELQKLSPQDRKNRLIQESLRITATSDQQNTLPQPEKSEQIAGQKCDLYASGITKTCLWEGIPLQTIASLPDYGIQTTTTATKIELNQPIADSEFAVPSDYKITELN